MPPASVRGSQFSVGLASVQSRQFSPTPALTQHIKHNPHRARGRDRVRVKSVLGQEVAEFQSPTKVWECDESHITVKQGKGSICHALMGARLEASAQRVFELFQRPDYDTMFRIFKLVKYHSVASDDGRGKQEFQLEFDAQWRFWKVRGTCAIPLKMHLDKSTGEIAFFQTKPGFLKVYKGAWRILELSPEGVPVDATEKPWFNPPEVPNFELEYKPKKADEIDEGRSLVFLELDVLPAFVPPPPLNRALKGNTASQVESLFEDLKKELNEGTEVVSKRSTIVDDMSASLTSMSDADVDISEQLAEATKRKKVNGLDFDIKFD
ncbi:hypothetical protein BSKO_03072 [Bryopsis sp. KO-2023]|nr:hypothetical protein BSKO_03072 [Bryopsis sp. KO-2023]